MDSPPRPLLHRLFLSPDGRLRSGWRALVQLILFQLLLVVCLLAFGWLFAFPLEDAGQLVVSSALSAAAMTAAVYLARRWLDRRSFRSLGLEWDGRARRDLLFGLALTGLLFGLIFLVEWAVGWMWVESLAWQVQPAPLIFSGVLLMVILWVLTGWQEELLSRGYQLQNLAEGANLLWGSVLSAAVFALLHYGNPSFAENVMPFAGLFAGGLFFAYAYLRTRRLWLPIGLHIGWNFFEGTVFGFPVSGLSGLPRLINQSVQGPELITGGSFGPEAGLIVLPALALGAVAVWLYTRGRAGGYVGRAGE